MSLFKFAIPALVLCAMTSSANAQTSFSNTYHVQVRIEMWTSGAISWQTVYSTKNYEDAVFMQDLYQIALEGDALSDLLDLSWYYIATGVRIQTEYPEQLLMPAYQSSLRRSGIYIRPSYQAPSY